MYEVQGGTSPAHRRVVMSLFRICGIAAKIILFLMTVASLRGAAAGIGRGVESTGVFGWVTGDRLRWVWLILIIKL